MFGKFHNKINLSKLLLALLISSSYFCQTMRLVSLSNEAVGIPYSKCYRKSSSTFYIYNNLGNFKQADMASSDPIFPIITLPISDYQLEYFDLIDNEFLLGSFNTRLMILKTDYSTSYVKAFDLPSAGFSITDLKIAERTVLAVTLHKNSKPLVSNFNTLREVGTSDTEPGFSSDILTSTTGPNFYLAEKLSNHLSSIDYTTRLITNLGSLSLTNIVLMKQIENKNELLIVPYSDTTNWLKLDTANGSIISSGSFNLEYILGGEIIKKTGLIALFSFTSSSHFEIFDIDTSSLIIYEFSISNSGTVQWCIAVEDDIFSMFVKPNDGGAEKLELWSFELIICDTGVQNCIECRFSQNHCTKCQSGYKLSHGNCVLDCSGSTPYILSEKCVENCKRGFYLEDKICKECSVGCWLCNNSFECQVCNPNLPYNFEGKCYSNCITVGRYAIDSSSCGACSENCVNCTSQNTCTLCEENFKLEDGICKSLDKTQNCKSENKKYQKGNCVENCGEEFYLYKEECLAYKDIENGFGLKSDNTTVTCFSQSCNNCRRDFKYCNDLGISPKLEKRARDVMKGTTTASKAAVLSSFLISPSSATVMLSLSQSLLKFLFVNKDLGNISRLLINAFGQEFELIPSYLLEMEEPELSDSISNKQRKEEFLEKTGQNLSLFNNCGSFFLLVLFTILIKCFFCILVNLIHFSIKKQKFKKRNTKVKCKIQAEKQTRIVRITKKKTDSLGYKFIKAVNQNLDFKYFFELLGSSIFELYVATWINLTFVTKENYQAKSTLLIGMIFGGIICTIYVFAYIIFLFVQPKCLNTLKEDFIEIKVNSKNCYLNFFRRTNKFLVENYFLYITIREILCFAALCVFESRYLVQCILCSLLYLVPIIINLINTSSCNFFIRKTLFEGIMERAEEVLIGVSFLIILIDKSWSRLILTILFALLVLLSLIHMIKESILPIFCFVASKLFSKIKNKKMTKIANERRAMRIDSVNSRQTKPAKKQTQNLSFTKKEDALKVNKNFFVNPAPVEKEVELGQIGERRKRTASWNQRRRRMNNRFRSNVERNNSKKMSIFKLKEMKEIKEESEDVPKNIVKKRLSILNNKIINKKAKNVARKKLELDKKEMKNN